MTSKRNTEMRQALMRLRGAYLANVRAGRTPMDKKLLKELDKIREIENGRR
jgi:hypothetical protein